MSYNKPSIDPADEGDLVGAFRHIFGKMMQNVDGMLPAKVISYDRTKNRATVQPLIMLLTTENQTVPRAQLASVPVYQIGGGGFILNFNLSPGDLGWIKASDRDISLFLQSYSQSAPNTIRKFSFSDSVFYPDVMKGYTIAGEDANNAVLQSLDGSVRIALWSNKVKITAPSVEVNAPTSLFTGDVHIQGALQVDTTIAATTSVTSATINGTTQVVFAGKNATTHQHSGVTAGTSNTGGPV